MRNSKAFESFQNAHGFLAFFPIVGQASY